MLIKFYFVSASRSTSGNVGTNNLPPLLFHPVHGDNIVISRDGATAKRAESFCKGITFSARPVKINEKVCIKFVEMSNNWSGVIRFGFTYNDPSNLRYDLPKYACPDLTNKPGYWAKALAERFCDRDTVLFYYVSASGDVHFGINGEEKGIFFSGVDTRQGPLWALIDVYGNSTAIEFVDIRHHLNNSRIKYSGSCDNTPDDVDRLIVQPMQGLNIQTPTQEEDSLPPLRNQPTGLAFRPVPFHRTRGRNVFFSSDRCIASRNEVEFCQGYVFTARPLQLGERIVVQILATETMYVGALALGLTSCDPATLQQHDLPDDSDLLLDRPEYWVVSKDVASNPQRGDELSFCVTLSGEVQISKNGGPATVVMHVDQSLKLWAFLDIYGSTKKIRLLSSPPTQTSPVRAQERSRCNIAMGSESMNSINGQTEARRNSQAVASNPRVCCVTPNEMSIQPNLNGGTVLVVNLPPTHANLLNHQQQNGAIPATVSHSHSQHSVHLPTHHTSSQIAAPAVAVQAPVPQLPAPVVHATSSSGIAPSSTGTILSTYSNQYIEVCNRNKLMKPPENPSRFQKACQLYKNLY